MKKLLVVIPKYFGGLENKENIWRCYEKRKLCFGCPLSETENIISHFFVKRKQI